jgi:hypothetical protein
MYAPAAPVIWIETTRLGQCSGMTPEARVWRRSSSDANLPARNGTVRQPLLFVASTALLAVLLLLAAGVAAPATGTTTCDATPVHFTPGDARGLSNVPWVKVGKAFRAYLFFYPPELADGRVNRASGTVIYTDGGTSAFSTKILWVAQRPRARGAVVAGQQLDGSGRFTQHLSRAGAGEFPSIIRLPAAGCWKVTVRSGRSRASIVVQAIDAPEAFSCDSTPVIRSGETPWLRATPRSTGITGTIFYPLPRDASGATIYPNGQAPSGAVTKILWRVPDRTAASVLRVRAQRLDVGAAVPPQEFPSANDSSPGAAFPSVIDVSTTGCWLLTVRSGRAAGVVVVNSIPSA